MRIGTLRALAILVLTTLVACQAVPTITPPAKPSPTFTLIPGSPGADQVIAYNPGLGQKEEYTSPEAALGAPDLVEEPCCSGMLQLGRGGSILLAFTDNAINDAAGPDFQVFGESARDDFIVVEVSADGQTWHAYPKRDESPEPFDLAEVGLDQVLLVRITDVQPGTSSGAELDAVEAIHSGPPLEGGLPTDLPEAMGRSDATLRQGPGNFYDALGEVNSGTVLAVEGRDPSGTWARVQTTEGEIGWCNITQLALNVSLTDYQVSEIPPTSTPIPPTLTPTPLPAIADQPLPPCEPALPDTPNRSKDRTQHPNGYTVDYGIRGEGTFNEQKTWFWIGRIVAIEGRKVTLNYEGGKSIDLWLADSTEFWVRWPDKMTSPDRASSEEGSLSTGGRYCDMRENDVVQLTVLQSDPQTIFLATLQR